MLVNSWSVTAVMKAVGNKCFKNLPLVLLFCLPCPLASSFLPSLPRPPPYSLLPPTSPSLQGSQVAYAGLELGFYNCDLEHLILLFGDYRRKTTKGQEARLVFQLTLCGGPKWFEPS